MPYGLLSRDLGVWEIFARWGMGLRRSRSISQSALEELSGIDQSAISRFERGLAPRMTAENLARIALVLPTFALGTCPHPHACEWKEPMRQVGPPPSLDRYRTWRDATDGNRVFEPVGPVTPRRPDSHARPTIEVDADLPPADRFAALGAAQLGYRLESDGSLTPLHVTPADDT